MSLTREKILDLGEDLIVTKGFNAFSYHDISKKLGVKNAAIHYYFPAKGNLSTSIVKNNILRFEEMVENFKTKNFSVLNQLEVFFRLYAKYNRESKICLFGSLGPDFNTLSESTQQELQKMKIKIIDWLADILEKGRNEKVLDFNGDANTRALIVLSNMVAGLQFSRINDKTAFKSIYMQILSDLKIKG